MKKNNIIILLMLSALIAGGCGSDNVSPDDSLITTNELKIYGKILDTVQTYTTKDFIYINDTTLKVVSFYIRSSAELRGYFPELEDETYNSFLVNSKLRNPVKKIPPTSKKNISLCSNCYSSVSGNNVYGVINFSSAGFNSNHTQAVVFMNIYRGDLSISDYYIILKKESDMWKIKAYILIGMS
jgi:hypothetical protein